MRELLFGVVYLPQVTCVEDFSPYWTTDNWTPRRMVTDLKIMRSVGCSCVRFHLYPSAAGEISFPGVDLGKITPMLDLAVETANELGLRVHLDLLQREDEEGLGSIRGVVDRYRGRIQSYQIGNERWDVASDERRLAWLQRAVETIHRTDPSAIASTDMLVPGWVRIRDRMPELYRQLDVALAHYYPVTDYRGWNETYLADLIDHLGNPTGRESVTGPVGGVSDAESGSENPRTAGYDARSQSYDHPFYAGSWAWLDKDVWITEISSHGYWRWGSLVPDDKRAADWEQVVDAVAGSPNRATRIYHHCFRNKMSWREFGRDQSGLVRYDGSPRPATFAFKKMAAKYAPEGSPLRALDCEIEPILARDGVDRVALNLTLANKTDSEIAGEAALDLPPGVRAEQDGFAFSIPAGSSKKWTTALDVGDLPCGHSHLFARVTIPQGLVLGWGVIARPERVVVGPTLLSGHAGRPGTLAGRDAGQECPAHQLAARVRYVRGIEAVQEFVDTYVDDCAIITGPALGSDAEMGYRLKIVLESIRCTEIRIRPVILAEEVLDRPLIVVGNPEFNLISRVVEMKLPDGERLSRTSPGPGMGLVNVVAEPLGPPSIEGRACPASEVIGYHFGACPAALYIAGSDEEGTRAAAYDLILRIWGSQRRYE